MTLARSPLAQRQRSIDDFASELRKLHAESFNRVDVVQDFLRKNSVNSESLSPYLRWDRQHYTRNLIDKTELYELVAICWEVGQASSIHNHRDRDAHGAELPGARARHRCRHL